MAATPCDSFPPVDLPTDPFGETLDSHLRTDGANAMGAPARIIDGSEVFPGLAFKDNTRSGFGRVADTDELFIGVDASRGRYGFPPELFGETRRGDVALVGDISPLWLTAVNSEAFTIFAGQPLMISGAGTVALARANSVANLAWAVATENLASGDTGRIMTVGVVSLPDWSAATGGPVTLTAGADYFLSPSTVGIITETGPSAPPDISQLLGRALSTTELIVNISEGMIL